MLTGHVTICKVFSDGTQEVVLDKENMITAGMGSSFCDSLEGRGAIYVEDFAPAYFQVGTSAQNAPVGSASAYFYQLSSPFDWQDYGPDTDIEVTKEYRAFLASSTDGINYTEMLFASAAMANVTYSGVDQYFAKVEDSRLTKYILDSFDSEIILDEKSGNSRDISEIGLFIKNPRGLPKPSPLLIAYKSFAPIAKRKNFSIIIHWTLGFLGVSNKTDKYYSPGPIEFLTGYGGPTEQ